MARTITTSKGYTYSVNYAWAPLQNGSCGISYQDGRALSKIAEEFEGLSSIHYTDTEAGQEKDFDGYTELTQISRTGEDVQITLIKGGGIN